VAHWQSFTVFMSHEMWHRFDMWQIEQDKNVSTLDHSDPSKPSHRLTNGPKSSKTIERDVSNTKNHWKTIGGNGQIAKKTFNGDGRLKNHWKFPMVSSKPLKCSLNLPIVSSNVKSIKSTVFSKKNGSFLWSQLPFSNLDDALL